MELTNCGILEVVILVIRCIVLSIRFRRIFRYKINLTGVIPAEFVEIYKEHRYTPYCIINTRNGVQGYTKIINKRFPVIFISNNAENIESTLIHELTHVNQFYKGNGNLRNGLFLEQSYIDWLIRIEKIRFGMFATEYLLDTIEVEARYFQELYLDCNRE